VVVGGPDDVSSRARVVNGIRSVDPALAVWFSSLAPIIYHFSPLKYLFSPIQSRFSGITDVVPNL